MASQHQQEQQPLPFYAIRTRRPADGSSMSSADSTYGSGVGEPTSVPSATHDTSRVNYHVKHLDSFVQTLQESASRAFPNKGRSSLRYKKVQALVLHWKSDDLFVLPELEDLERCLREVYRFDTEVFAIPSDNPHLELMLKVGALIKEHESEDTLFVVYYGGHAKIDESRQSTWCATRHSGSPWLQWSAIQTLLERSMSDVLILLDCCAGAASATFPSGKSITETISASSWDAIAPDPGRYSFTNALIEILGEWRHKTYSAAMLHAELLARLKHPRPILINGKQFEARSTPVHFMMTSNHRAPSIEISYVAVEDESNERRPPSPPRSDTAVDGSSTGSSSNIHDVCDKEPNEVRPHVMISLALEDDQRLDLNAWEQWLSSFPALAKHVTVQGVFKSHSTLLLLSMPVMIWDLLPDDQACSFVAFIRSNNLIKPPKVPDPASFQSNVRNEAEMHDRESIFSGTTYTSADNSSTLASTLRNHHPALHGSYSMANAQDSIQRFPERLDASAGVGAGAWRTQTGSATMSGPLSMTSMSVPLESPANLSLRPAPSTTSFRTAPPGFAEASQGSGIIRRPLLSQARASRRHTYGDDEDVPEGPPLAAHVVARLEEYYRKDSHPNVGITEYYASNLGIIAADVNLWFHHRRQQERMTTNLQNLRIDDNPPEVQDGPRMILSGHLNDLLDIFTPTDVLIVDLRTPSIFQKSHIHGAVNLRLPVNFLKIANLDTIDRTFTDEQSRRSFSTWSRSRCVVFYDRNAETPADCPTATVLLNKFRNEGWSGQCFILKGPFREFSMSYDKYITGDRMTKEANDYFNGIRQREPLTDGEKIQCQTRYSEWLRRLEENRVPPPHHIDPAEMAQRKTAAEEHQQELLAEFESSFPDLYKRMQDVMDIPPPPPPKHGKDNDNLCFNTRKAPLVDHLSTGLNKMREAVGKGGSEPSLAGYSFPRERTLDKVGELPLDDFDEIDPKQAQSRPWDDRLYGRPPYGGKSAAKPGRNHGDEGLSHKSTRERPGIWKRLRSNGK